MGAAIFAAIGIPVAFLLVGAFGKKLVRASPFELSDFFFGPELSLSALSGALVFAIDLSQIQQQGASVGNTALTNVAFIVVVLMIYLVLLGLQQEWDKPTIDHGTKFWRLVVMSNLLGGGLFAAFVFLVKGL